MNQELDIEHDVAYHRRFWRVQRIAWSIWALIMIAAFVGLFGPGIKGKRTISDKSSGLSLTFERLIRNQSPAELKIHLTPTTESNSETRIAINRAYIDAVESQLIQPEPEKQEGSKDEIVYTFHRNKPREPMTVVFRYEAKTSGKIPIQIRLDENSAIFAEQFSFP